MTLFVERGITPEPPPIRKSGEGPHTVELQYREKLADALRNLNGRKEQFIPTLLWPFNEATMRNPDTRIPSYHSEALPGIAIQAPPDSISIIRSPADSIIEAVNTQSNGLYTIVLSTQSDIVFVLRQLLVLIPGVKAIQNDEFFTAQTRTVIHAGEILGSLGKRPYNIIEMQAAYKPEGPKTQLHRSDMIDPLPLLRRLYPLAPSDLTDYPTTDS